MTVALCVDLDGTLIKTDTLHELTLRLIKLNIFYIFMLPLWLLKGKANLKHKINQLVTLNVELLPYDQEILTYLREQKNNGRTLVLVTGCNKLLANKIAQHIGLFDEVHASDESKNLTSNNKAAFLVEKYGEKQFDYIGNESADLPVWNKANCALVAAEQGFCQRVTQRYDNSETFVRNSISIKTFIKAIRLHQWVKNLLIFVPLILASQLFDSERLFLAIGGFVAFSLLASATYLLNDLLDLDSDRTHHKKKHRAMACGAISIMTACKIGLILFLATLILLLNLPLEFGLVSVIYLITTLLYSFHIKTMAILDTCVLAGLFTIRVVGGTAVIDADWSFWLLAFSMFFFLSLAFTKRASELYALAKAGKTEAKGRGYVVEDSALVTSMGISSGYIGVMVIALYINSEKVISTYATPNILWLICPLLLYWIGRIWIKTVRGQMNEDPIIFALKDKVSHIAALICALVIFCATVAW